MTALTSSRGFTLVETLVATGVLITAFAGVAQLLVLSAQWSRTSATSNAALAAAQSKIEELGALAFTYDAAGLPLTDDGLLPSGASTLDRDTESFSDEVDGIWRRWRITTYDAAAPDAIVIEVCAFRDGATGVAHGGADACLSTIRTRQP
jgi:type II secretory pathway pseudopilin PulG